MTWLDWFVRQRAELARTRRLAEGRPLPRIVGGAEEAFAAFAEEAQAVASGSDASSSRAHALFCRCLAPFLQGFLPHALRRQDPGPALGLVLRAYSPWFGSPPPRAVSAAPRAPSAGWPLTARQEVSGHFKLQPHGPGGSLRRLIWVDAYERGPDDAAVRPRAVRL